jgi:hypothetical protein
MSRLNRLIILSLLDFVARLIPHDGHSKMYHFNIFSSFCMAKIIDSQRTKI